jgi:hypothetical protein
MDARIAVSVVGVVAAGVAAALFAVPRGDGNAPSRGADATLRPVPEPALRRVLDEDARRLRRGASPSSPKRADLPPRAGLGPTDAPVNDGRAAGTTEPGGEEALVPIAPRTAPPPLRGFRVRSHPRQAVAR